MSTFKRIEIISKLTLVVTAVFFLGLVSCGNNDESPYDGWKYVGEVRAENDTFVSVYIDLKGMEVEGNIRKFWVRHYADKGGDSKEKYIRQLGYWEVECQDRELYVLGEEYYNSNGKVLGRSEERIKEDYSKDSLGDKMTYAACRYAGRK